MDYLRKVISDLCEFSPRQGLNETKAANYLENFLQSNHINYSIQIFETEVPIVDKVELYLDGQKIPCLGGSFESGKITSKSQIQFSSYSDFIETINYPQTPGLHISRTNKSLLEKAKKISGEVVVTRTSFISKNILVGNSINPNKIIFAHYDSLGGGALDNAGSVAICLELATQTPDLLTGNLFVFAGNEELSYDGPIYWGKGFREFEREYDGIILQAKEILIVDGVGVSRPMIIKEDLEEVFPINKLQEIISKVSWISSDQEEVLKAYHCKEDTVDRLNFDFLDESLSLLKAKLQK